MKRSNEVTVGILVTAAVIILILGSLWLARGGLSSGYPLYTRFPWGQNLKQGQPVLLAGVSVGYVSDVKLERDGYLDVTLTIDNDYTIPKGSTATVKPVGIFGDVAVGLTPSMPVSPKSYAPGDTLPTGAPAADIGQIMNRVDSIGQSVSVLMTALKTQMVDAGTLRDLHQTIASTAVLSRQLQGVLAEQNRNLTQTMATFRIAAARMSGAVDSTRIAATMANLETTSANFARLTADLDSTNNQVRVLLAKAEGGNGTVGKLLSDSLMYSDMRHLLGRADSLLADIKANPKRYINVSIF